MAFDAFSAVQSFADGNRSLGDVVKDLSAAELADLREQVKIQLQDMPQNGDPARAERLQQLRTLLKGSVRSMIGTLAASLAFSKATGISLETTESATEKIVTAKQITAPETRTVLKEAAARPNVSAFDKPAEQTVIATNTVQAAAQEKPALTYADYKNMADPKKEKNFFQNAMGYMTYRAARFIAKSSAKDSMLGKMFKKFGWDKNATALTALMELGANTPKPEVQKPAESVPPAVQAPLPNVPPSVLPAPEVVRPPVTSPQPSVPPESAPVVPAPVLPVEPSPAIPPAIRPTLPTDPLPTPTPTPKPEIPSAPPNLFDGSLEGKNLLDGVPFNVDGHTISLPNDKQVFVTFDGRKFKAIADLFVTKLDLSGESARLLLDSAVMEKGDLRLNFKDKSAYVIKRAVLVAMTKEIVINKNKKISTDIPVTVITPGKPNKEAKNNLTLQEID